jgi:hypothetical protein
MPDKLVVIDAGGWISGPMDGAATVAPGITNLMHRIVTASTKADVSIGGDPGDGAGRLRLLPPGGPGSQVILVPARRGRLVELESRLGLDCDAEPHPPGGSSALAISAWASEAQLYPRGMAGVLEGCEVRVVGLASSNSLGKPSDSTPGHPTAHTLAGQSSNCSAQWRH